MRKKRVFVILIKRQTKDEYSALGENGEITCKKTENFVGTVRENSPNFFLTFFNWQTLAYIIKNPYLCIVIRNRY